MEKAMEKEYEVLNPSETEEQEMAQDWNREAFSQYEYFDFDTIRQNGNFQTQAENKGRELLAQKKLKIDSVDVGYTSEGEQVAEAFGTGQERSYPFRLHLVISRDRILHAGCECYECTRSYYRTHYYGSRCAFISGMLEYVKEYVGKHRLGDTTDYNGQVLLQVFREQHANAVVSSSFEKQNPVRLVPRLVQKEGGLQLSFKVGQQKLFVVKNLREFYDNVKYSRTEQYGNDTQLNHRRDNFTKEGQQWLRFIEKVMQEIDVLENEFEYGEGYLPKSLRKPASIDLTGWKLDEFYQMLGTEGIEYEDKRSETRGKGIVHAGTGKPSVRLTIRKTKLSKGNPKEFHGITVSCRLPKLLYGVETAYYLEQDQLLKVPEEFFKKICLLGETTGEENTMFRIGRNHLADFYYTVLPQLEDAVEIFEEDSDEIQKYLPPQGKLLYYLDAEDGRLLCRAGVRYGTQEYDARESIENRMLEPFRERTREQEAVYFVSLWFPDFDEKTREYYCENEERIYEFLTQGLEMLLQSGEVHCTARFRNLKVDRKVKMSMGISISQGLLNLDISSGDISAEEMEEILGSYRAKKKYHRLKNGSFLSMEDENVATLEELTKALRMSVGELLQEEVHLPLYRALYLDKLLEQKEEIYANRDSHFRELVKNFKTVQDSDFEEPPQLKQVLRGYQSFGYRWLRTLEEYRMGGILADDMGLGKTLQAIAVLSAAKQEGRKGTSLIVAPASLVFNWGEELNRFAPELSVELITGTQTERSNSLKNFGRTDVFVTSYDLLKRDIAEYHGKQFEYQIIDEAQYIKNHSTAAAKAVKAIESKTRFALTGTPIENRLSELWSIFDFLMPGYLYGYEVFRREFESPIVREADEAAMERLKKMTAPFILRRLKEQVLKDLPEKLEEHRYVRLFGEQKRLYEAQVQRLKQSIAMQDAEEFQKNKLQVLAEITKIRQLCCDPSLCYENYQGESAKKEACMELIQSAMEGGHRMLVFSQFTSMLELLQKELTERQIAYYTITGDVPKEKRLQLVREFNEGDVPVFLISLKAGGVGLNLTGADVVIHYDPWWNLAVQNQATDRAHRIGQTKKVVVYKLLVKDSMEEKIQKLQESKKQLSDQIVGETANQLSNMSKEEFLALFE